jgi:hypothetical protein
MVNEAICLDTNYPQIKENDLELEKRIRLEEIKSYVNHTDNNIKNLVDTSSLIKNDTMIINESVKNIFEIIKKEKGLDFASFILSNELCVSTFKMQEMLTELEKSYHLLQETFLSIKILSNQIK